MTAQPQNAASFSRQSLSLELARQASEREAAPRRLAEAASSFQAALAELRAAEAALERQLGDLRAVIDAAPVAMAAPAPVAATSRPCALRTAA